jgi:hypothetical protein
MSAKNAEESIGWMNARTSKGEVLEHRAKRPRYTRGLLWDGEEDLLSATAQYSLTAQPLPNVPIKESYNTALMETILNHPNLFKVNCPVKID